MEDRMTVEEVVDTYEEEEVFEDGDEEEDMVEEVTEGNDDEYEEEEVVTEPPSRALEATSSVDFGEEQDVFRALDEAEKQETSLPPSPPPRPSTAAPVQTRSISDSQPQQVSASSRAAMPQRDENKCSQNTIILLVVFVGLIAIAAIVLPFVLDYGNNDEKSSGDPSPTVPTPPPEPTVSPAPTSDDAPTPVPFPTTSPTTLRLSQFIEQYLVPVSGSEVFEDTNSPQFRAAQYIAEVDPFTSELTSVDQLGDRYAAITFYFATNGDDWFKCYYGDESCEQGQWLVNDVCGWFAVSCDDLGRIEGFLFGKCHLLWC